MTTQLSIESLRADVQSAYEGFLPYQREEEIRNKVLAALTELETLRAGAVEAEGLRVAAAGAKADRVAAGAIRESLEGELDALRAELAAERANWESCAEALDTIFGDRRQWMHGSKEDYEKPDPEICPICAKDGAWAYAELQEELAAETKRREEAERWLDESKHQREGLVKANGILKANADAAEARNVELAARVEALKDGLKAIVAHVSKVGDGGGHWWYMNYAQTLLLTPWTCSLAAHDAKVREPLEARIKHLESRICKTCEGLGVVHVGTGYASSDGGEDFREDDCPDCVGAIQKEALRRAVKRLSESGYALLSEDADDWLLLLETVNPTLDPKQLEELRCERSEYDARIRREALEAAAKKCATAYWEMVAPRDHAAMHPTIEFWREALDLPAMTPAEHEAQALREPRHPEIVLVDDLAMLVRQLVHSLRKHSPDNTTAARAVDYLKRHELQGSPLRGLSPAPDAAQPNNQQEQP